MSTVPDRLATDLKKTKTPFLAIHGTDDPLVPIDNGTATARLVPGSKFRPLEGAGHMFFNEDTWAELAEIVAARCRRC